MIKHYKLNFVISKNFFRFAVEQKRKTMNYEIVNKEQNLRLFLENKDDWELLDDIWDKHQSGEMKLCDLMEETGLLGNSELNFVAPEQIGALTESLIISDNPILEEDDLEGIFVWWFPDYQIKDPSYELAEKGEVIFANGKIL